MNISAIVFTDRGMELGERLRVLADGDFSLTRCAEGGLNAWVESHFCTAQALLFIGAAGIAVRAIAPYLHDKQQDPAVLVLDEGGNFVVPILSGHSGGANELARELASKLNALPVITTATDVRGLWAADNWARRHKLAIDNPERVKWISARLLAGENIRVKSLFPIAGDFPPGLMPGNEDYDVLISWRRRGRAEALRLIPPVVTLGVGCKRGVSSAALREALEMTLAKVACHPAALLQVASIEMKADEPGLLDFCRELKLPLRLFSAAKLAALPGQFSGSEFVQKVTGVDNVCERAAVAGSGGRLLSAKNAGNGVAMAMAIAPYSISFEGDI